MKSGMWMLFLLFVVPVFANDASFAGHGASVYLVKEQRIAMQSEDIKISYNRESNFSKRKWKAECRFRFRNLTNETVEVTMGFPDWILWSETIPGHWAIAEFQTKIKGQTIKASHKSMDTSGKLPGQLMTPYQAAYTWQVKFIPNETIEVYNSYTFGGFSSNGPFSQKAQSSHLTNLYWRALPESQRPQWDYDNSAFRQISYIVTTGLTWASPIGEANISIEMPPHILPNAIVASPQGYTIDKGYIHWNFRNWTPQQEIDMYVLYPITSEMNCFTSVAEAKAWWESNQNNTIDRETIYLLWNAILAKYGCPFSDPKLQQFFQDRQSNPDFSMQQVSVEDQKIIAYLQQIEIELGSS